MFGWSYKKFLFDNKIGNNLFIHVFQLLLEVIVW